MNWSGLDLPFGEKKSSPAPAAIPAGIRRSGLPAAVFPLASGPAMRHDSRNVGANHVMQVAYSEEGPRLIARLQGRMEASDGDAFAAAVGQRLKPGLESLTIDLGELDFISFGGIRALLRLARSLKASATTLGFVAGRETVRDALDQAGLDDFFPFTPPYVSNRGTVT